MEKIIRCTNHIRSYIRDFFSDGDVPIIETKVWPHTKGLRRAGKIISYDLVADPGFSQVVFEPK